VGRGKARRAGRQGGKGKERRAGRHGKEKVRNEGQEGTLGRR
jgi:hypothetical protein